MKFSCWTCKTRPKDGLISCPPRIKTGNWPRKIPAILCYQGKGK